MIPAPIGYYSGLAWVQSDLLVVAYNPEKEEPGQPILPVLLWTVGIGDGKLEMLPISKEDPACVLTQYRVPTTLSDGRVAFVKSCTPHDLKDGLTHTAFAYDLETGRVEQLGPPLDFFPIQIDWNPAAGKGILAKSNRICATVAWLTRQGVEYLPALIEDEEGTFRLDDGYTDVDPDCSKGRADWPTWSADGRQIAFFASPRSVGVEGMARLSEPWNMYVMDPDELRPRKLLADVTDPVGLRWSPNGEWLAFDGELPGQGRGTWLFELESGRLERVSEEGLGGPTWSPDGGQIVGTLTHGDDSPPQRELVILDVSSTVSGS